MCVDEELSEAVVDIAVDVDPLHADAVLARRPEGAGDAGLGRPLDIGVVPHDDRRVGAELHADLLEPGLGDDAFAGLDAAGEADHADSWVRHQGVAEHRAVAGEALEDTRRQTGLDKGLGQSFSADSGVTVAGLRITVLPPAMAGPSLWATRLRGSLNGVMASTTPIGTRSK